MTFQGLDPQVVKQAADGMARQAAVLDRITHEVDALIRTAMHHWSGPEAQDFHQWWVGQHRPRLVAAAQGLHGAAANVRQQVADQEEASGHAPGSAGSSFGGPRTSAAAAWAAILGGATSVVTSAGGVLSTVKDGVETAKGDGKDILARLPHGSALSASLKGIGLGDALAGVATGVRDGDVAGAVGSGADGVFTFAPAPISLLWTGLKTEVGFFLPLDGATADEHFSWMQDRGYTADQISERYSGVQGFITYGNDNVERHAPWMNRIADKAMEKPAEWLYHVGIRF